MSMTVSALALLLSGAITQTPPPLPAGLGSTQTEETEQKEQSGGSQSSLPSLPSGLGSSADKDQEKSGPSLPSLPGGLGSKSSGTVSSSKSERTDSSNWFTENVNGFVELRAGARLQDDANEDDTSIGELRAQFQTEIPIEEAVINLTADLVADTVANETTLDLEEGRGFIDLREANLVFRPLDNMDVKLGRQIATWGTGDLVFINDLFPKDYNSFFVGRDDEYLKAPSDAIRASLFTDFANFDVVYTPRFDHDRYIDGNRISYLNPLTGEIAGQNAIIDPLTPDEAFDDDELAVRASRNIGKFEVAAYGYDGFWKSPNGITPTGQFTFPELAVFGASIRGPVAGGIANAEFGYYDSTDDSDGTNPFLPNSQTRYLVGFEKEAATDLTVAVQYYAEVTEDYDALISALPTGMPVPDETRHVITTRITKLAYNQNLILSLFNFYSPNQEDGYARARATYKINDDWQVDGGANVFYGEETAFFGQFEDNTNAFVGVRRSF